jgi:hypothetical protein
LPELVETGAICCIIRVLYGNSCLSQGNVYKWIEGLKGEWTNVDYKLSEWASAVK